MSAYEDAWYKTEEFEDAWYNDNPEKEFTEYEQASKIWKQKKKAYVNAVDDYCDAAKEYNRLSKEYSKAENAGDAAKCEALLSDIQEAAEELERIEAAKDKAKAELDEAEKVLNKERNESKQAAEKAAESGDNSWVNRQNARTSIDSEFDNFTDKEITDKLKEAKSLIAEADRNLKHSLEKMESQLSNTGHQLMNGANAAMDPNGVGGIKVAEALAMGALSLSKSTISAIKGIKASIQKRNATGSVEKLTSVLDERHNSKEEPVEEGPELD